jgi:methyl-accepting chemotaxis protein
VTLSLDSVRKGTTSTARALSEQAAVSEQVTAEVTRLSRLIAAVSKAMDEQAAGASQITSATADIRRQSEQASRGLGEQARAAAEINTATQSIAREVAIITRSNREQTVAAETVLDILRDIRQLQGEGLERSKVSGADIVQRLRTLAAPPAR